LDPEEKGNFHHYIASAEADIAAVNLSNNGQPFGAISDETIHQILELKKRALAEAKLVRDDVLEKAFVGMSDRYRHFYQRSLELQVRSLEVKDLSAEIEGSRLHDEWVDWIEPRQVQIRVPK
jgi:hypothetical protein